MIDVEDRLDGLWKTEDAIYNIITIDDDTLKIIDVSTGKPLKKHSVILFLTAVMPIGTIIDIRIHKNGKEVLVIADSRVDSIAYSYCIDEG